MRNLETRLVAISQGSPSARLLSL